MDPIDAGYYELVAMQQGWPARAFRGSSRAWPSGAREEGVLSIGRHRGFLYLPLWPGFALDTAFYGTLAFLLWTARGGAGFVRRRSRRKRGRCIACGYDLKGLAKCPECGA